MEEVKINVKIKLSALWVAVTLCYLYGDVFGFFEPGIIEEIIAGASRGIQITQVTLLAMAIAMAIPSVMVFLSLTLKYKANRWANIILGIFYTCFMLFTMLTATYAFYIFLGIVEVVLTVLIVWYAWKWPKQEG
jgi:uncharacterized membrane protein